MAAAIFLLAGTIKGTLGIGLPVTAVGLLTLVGDARLAVTLAIMPIFVTNVWQVFRTGGIVRPLKKYWRVAIPMVALLYATALFATSVSTEVFSILLGVVIVVFSVLNLTTPTPEIPQNWDRPAQVVAGTLAGIFGGLTAIWAPPLVIYFLSNRLQKIEFINTIGAMFFVGSIPLMIGYVQNGLLWGQTGLASLALVVPAAIGFLLGERLRNVLPAETFRKLVLIVFLITGLNILRSAFF